MMTEEKAFQVLQSCRIPGSSPPIITRAHYYPRRTEGTVLREEKARGELGHHRCVIVPLRDKEDKQREI